MTNLMLMHGREGKDRPTLPPDRHDDAQHVDASQI